ncbi:MAG TPA: thymidine phosphorylase [Candidatus Krumholzibacteria bacterium]|nr:thymidine phosphorylase [Candidatus Krumholzibacteria bacterium]HRX50277.1 thymidine phosphorylase [Candidatus Krumholzibacteria bacterium]
MTILQAIETKKRGGRLDDAAIARLIRAYVAEEFPDYQMAALLMAVWFRGMDDEETVALTGAMLRSGRELDWSHLDRPTADKHSTGGVGDKVSLLLAPLAAACGLAVPMLSGRGLGHTGGTLDKLEAIPGYRIRLSNEEFDRVVREHGCAIVGQGPEIAPADGRIYALRDVTGTVDCVPLITASIMSKKLAAGPGAVVIDLKVGDGAFMTDLDQARELARRLVLVGRAHGRRMAVRFTDMSQPLGVAVGHANETLEACDALRPDGRGRAPADLTAVTEELVAAMLTTAGVQPDHGSALAAVRAAWDRGEALDALLAWTRAQGGRLDPDREDFGLDVAERLLPVEAPRDGVVTAVACREVGLALGEIGGARRTVDDVLDLRGGIDMAVRVGDAVSRGQPLAWIRAADRDAAARCAERVARAIAVDDGPARAPDLVLDRLD